MLLQTPQKRSVEEPRDILNCCLVLSDSLSLSQVKLRLRKIISPQSEKPQEVSKEQGKAPRAELAPAKGLKRRKSSTIFVYIYP